MMIQADRPNPPLNEEFRQAVRAAAGTAYLRGMTDRCLDGVDALIPEAMSVPAGTPQLVRELHRLAGGTAAIGLPGLAGSLRALEHAYQDSCEPALLRGLWERCRASAQECRAALSSEGS